MFSSLFPLEQYMYSSWSIGIYSCRYYLISLCFTNWLIPYSCSNLCLSCNQSQAKVIIILYYLKSTVDLNLVLSKHSKNFFDLIGWTNLNWAQDPSDHHSIDEFVFDVTGSFISVFQEAINNSNFVCWGQIYCFYCFYEESYLASYFSLRTWLFSNYWDYYTY